MTRFEPRPSGVGSDRSANCATTTTALEIAQLFILFFDDSKTQFRNVV